MKGSGELHFSPEPSAKGISKTRDPHGFANGGSSLGLDSGEAFLACLAGGGGRSWGGVAAHEGERQDDIESGFWSDSVSWRV